MLWLNARSVIELGITTATRNGAATTENPAVKTRIPINRTPSTRLVLVFIRCTLPLVRRIHCVDSVIARCADVLTSSD